MFTNFDTIENRKIFYMDIAFLNNIIVKLNELGSFLFNTYTGIAILVALSLVLSLLIAFVLEKRSKNKFFNQE